MKRADLPGKFLAMDFIPTVFNIWSQCRKQKLPLAIFIGLCLNLLVAPVVYATAAGTLERPSAWAIGILGGVTLAMVIYLFVVVFQPERF
jgi:K+-transporting ATPase KdpF subunit